ncbi:MAG: hypothetical protein ACLPKB_01305 [Xanthobacteraceae bacterium]
MTDSSIYSGTASEFRIGRVLGRAWTVFTKNFVILLAIGIIASLPNLVLGNGSSATMRPEDAWKVGLVLLLWIALNTLGQAVIVYVAFQSLRRQPIRISEVVQKGLGRFWPIIGIILCYIGVMLAFALVGGAGALLVISAGGGSSAGFIVTFLLGIAAIVVGGMLFIRWSIAVPVCVVERFGAIASLGRSSDLTKGHRWAVLAINLLVYVFLVLAMIVFGLLGALVLLPSGGVPTPSSAGVAALQVGNLLWNAVWIAYYNSVLVMIYHDLRAVKDGVGTDDIAAVFD